METEQFSRIGLLLTANKIFSRMRHVGATSCVVRVAAERGAHEEEISRGKTTRFQRENNP